MTALKTRLVEDLKEAMRANQPVRRTTIRSVLAAIKLAQVEKEKGTVLDDVAVLALVQKEIKSRRESIADAEKANRPDLISGYEAEIKILEEYLPKQLSQDELNVLVSQAIQETGASTPADMGKVMKIIIPRVQGRAPNDQVSAAVRELLQK
jgi:uncharacterized protein